MQVSSNSAEFNSENRREVEIECSKRSEHGGSGKHDVEMTNNVKRIMEQNIHTSVSDCHSTNTTGNEKENKK